MGDVDGHAVPADEAIVTNVLLDVFRERMRQNQLWGGDQSWPVHGLPRHAGNYAMQAREWQRQNDHRLAGDTFDHSEMAWDGILLEEVFEALAETDPVKQREELVQVAAVALAICEDLDRKQVKR